MDFLNYFPTDINVVISQHLQKQNIQEVLKNISMSIGKNEEEYESAKKGNISKDLINKVKEDAKRIRYEIQINNQEIYKVYTFVSIKSKSKKDVILYSEMLRTKLLTKMLKVNTLNFRHIQGYLATKPFGYCARKYLPSYFVNMTTNNVKMLFPFYTDTIIEEQGILFGIVKNEGKLCVIDLFEKTHLNSNMCIFGSSGGGKSYFTKLIILRNYLRNIRQYVIDLEGEYLNLPATVVNLITSKINILQIYDSDIKENFFYLKVNKVLDLIVKICNLYGYEEVIKEAIIYSYKCKGINEDINSVYLSQNSLYLDKKLLSNEKFPTIDDVIENIKLCKKLKKSEIKTIVSNMEDSFGGSFNFLSGITNVDIKSEIIVFDISSKQVSNKSLLVEFILNYIKDDIENYSKSLIYIDEAWKIILNNENVQNTVLDFYKTVRKRGCGIISITQDLSDFFSMNNQGFGKSIFNNSYIKIFFKMGYNDLNMLQNIGINSGEEYDKMMTLSKGEMLMYFRDSSIILKALANEYENMIIEGGKY